MALCWQLPTRAGPVWQSAFLSLGFPKYGSSPQPGHLKSGIVLFQDNHYEWIERWVDRHSSLSSCIGELWATCNPVSQRVSRGLEPQLLPVINQFNNSPFIGAFPSLLIPPCPYSWNHLPKRPPALKAFYQVLLVAELKLSQSARSFQFSTLLLANNSMLRDVLGFKDKQHNYKFSWIQGVIAVKIFFEQARQIDTPSQ